MLLVDGGLSTNNVDDVCSVVVVGSNLNVGKKDGNIMTDVFDVVDAVSVFSAAFVAFVFVVVSPKLSNCEECAILLQLSLPQRHTVQFTPLLQDKDPTTPFIPQPRAYTPAEAEKNNRYS